MNLRALLKEIEELRFEKSCLWLLVALFVLMGIAHFAMNHAPIQ